MSNKYYWMSYEMDELIKDDVTVVHPFIVITKLRRNPMYRGLLNWKEISEEEYTLFNNILYDRDTSNHRDLYKHFITLGFDLEDLRKEIPKDFVGEFSVRTFNVLISSGIYTLKDLLKASKEDLMRYRNFGKKSFEELNDWLFERYHWVIK